LPDELVKQLLEAGVHFGHQSKRWNPKMAKYIFGKRSGIYIVDLEKTAECLNAARDFVLDLTADGGYVLFVGTKRQAKEIIEKEAQRCGMFWVSERWLGGLLTNYSTVKKSINRLKDIEKMREDGTFEKLTKKEVAGLERESGKLKKYFSGIVNMESMPGCLFIVDTKKEETAVKEAKRLSIPVVALIDTNSNPDKINYPIPGNDDAIKSIQLIVALITDTVIEGRKRFLEYLSKEGVSREKIKPEVAPIAPETEKEVEKVKVEEIVEVVKLDEEVEKPLRKIHKGPREDRKPAQ
jgi:small subunit ribosomal protein S2